MTHCQSTCNGQYVQYFYRNKS